jgi:hypothetical protein
MLRIDENQEVMARIRMYVDMYDSEIRQIIKELNETDGDPPPKPTERQDNWALGSPLRIVYLDDFYDQNRKRPGFNSFPRELSKFLAENVATEKRPSEPYKVGLFDNLKL